MNKPIFEFDKKSGLSSCIIVTKQSKTFVGTAQCHPEDMDMNSQFTGIAIAEMRAQIYALKDIRDNELIPELRALKQLHGSMKHSSKFNPKSYENIMLQRQIRQKESAIADVRELIGLRQEELRRFIYEKEKCYQGIRKHRAEAVHEQGQKEIK